MASYPQALGNALRQKALRVSAKARKLRTNLWNSLSRDEYFNRKNRSAASNVPLPPIQLPVNPTSVSDEGEYRQVVEGAANDDSVFTLFRSHPQYSPILEHVSKAQGYGYLEVIGQRSNLPADWAARCDELNHIGSPPRFTYPSLGRFSPTLLRYVKVYSDLELLFGPVRGLRYIEIGAGFGGQAAILDVLGEVGSVQLYDLPPVLALAEKFMQSAGVTAHSVFRDGTTVEPAQPADLVVSNYAFSELTRSLQLTYLEKVISKVPMGYITWNSLSPDGLHPSELIERIPSSKILEEQPRTHRDNVIIAWGSSQFNAFSSKSASSAKLPRLPSPSRS